MAGSLSEELLAIRIELEGAKKAIEESNAVAKSQKEIGTSTTSAGKAAEKSGKSTSRLSKIYGALGKAAKYSFGFLGVGAVFALHSAVEKTEELAKTTSALSRNMGLSSEMASRWGAVAQAREIDSKSLGMSLGTLGKRFVEAAHKGGSALTPFHQLGISNEELAKGAKNSEQAILIAAKAFGKAEGGPRRQAAAMALLGKGWSTVLPLMSEGTASLKEQLGWADEFGVTLKGKTSEGLMEMVNSSRKSKVAILGLQIAMTKALMPAIEGGQNELQTFIKTLNDPHLSGEQKIARIEKQFEGLEEKLVGVVEQALPKIAENGGKLGLALAKAVWHSFVNSSFLGKLFIGFWIFKAIGGFSALSTLGAKIGGKLATSLGTKFLETVAPYFAAEAGVEGLGSAVGSQMGGLKTLFASKGAILGGVLGVAAAGAIAFEIQQGIKEQSLGGLIAPQSIDSSGFEQEDTFLTGLGYKVLRSSPGHITAINPWGKKQHFSLHHGEWETKEGGHWRAPHKFGKKPPHHRPTSGHPRPRQHKLNMAAAGRGGDRPLIAVVQVDGKTIATATAKYAEDAAALA